MKDIATAANVSVSAVSIALRNKPGVSDSKRSTILRIASELGYESQKQRSKNPISSGYLRLLRSKSHGVAISLDKEIFSTEYLDGIEYAAKNAGYGLEYSSFDPDRIPDTVAAVNGSDTKGVIIQGTELTIDEIKQFEKIDFPIVCIDTYFDLVQNIDFFDMNNREAVKKVVSYLVENNHKEIGLVTSTLMTRNFTLRESGYFEAMKHFGLLATEDRIFRVGSTFNTSYVDFLALLEKGRKPPTALFAGNDILAYGACKALREKGLRVPEDVSIVGFGDLPIKDVVDVGLTTIRVPKREMAQIATEFLARRVSGDLTTPSVRVLLSGELILRESVDKKLG